MPAAPCRGERENPLPLLGIRSVDLLYNAWLVALASMSATRCIKLKPFGGAHDA